MTTQVKILRVSAAAAAFALAAAGGSHAQSIGPHPARTPAIASATRPEPLSDDVKAAIDEALQDERRGETMYARVLEDHGDVRPFSNVVHAEGRHAALLEDLLRSRGLDVPAHPAGAEAAAYASVKEACAAAVEFETKNAALYDRLLAPGPLPDDVKRVFDHNRMASLEHHKPAFERCGGVATAHGPGRGAGRCGHGCGRGGHGDGQGCSHGRFGQGCGHVHGQGCSHGHGCGHCGLGDGQI